LIVTSSVVSPGSVHAQEVIDLDVEDGEEKAEAAAEAQGPVVAGQMTEDAAAAKRLFDKQRWAEAAGALHRVVAGETGDDPGNQQLAQYWLAISLYHLKFFQASYSTFAA